MLKSRIKSFYCALSGIAFMVKNEIHAKVHAVATIIVITAGFTLSITKIEWTILIIAIGIVWITELINTAIEVFADRMIDRFDPQIKIVKDLSAGAVLIASTVAFCLGIFIFYPYF